MNKPLLKIHNLHAGYADVPVLKGASLVLQPGSMSVLMGPNGAGKSTLLKSIFHLTLVTGGSVQFKGEDITGLPAHELLSRGIAFVSQGRINFSMLTVRENLLFGAHHIRDKAEVDERLSQIFDQFPLLKKHASSHAFSLSGGQQQMLAIGRALMSAPKLLLMDEPSLGLAPKLVKQVFASIQEIQKQFGVTTLIVEHNLKSLMEVADYGFVMVQGSIIAEDACERLKKSDIMQKVFVGVFD